MEKTIVIDGKSVTFKSTGAIPLRYKAQFHRDFFADLVSLVGKIDINKIKEGTDLQIEDISNVNFETFYNVAWTYAKTADKDILPPLEWLDSFDEFPIFQILPELQDMLMKTVQTGKK